MNCLIVDEDNHDVPTGKCCMVFDATSRCNNHCFNNKLLCNDCLLKSKERRMEQQKQKDQYIAYKKSQDGCIGFGKYKNKTVDWLLVNDKEYARWLLNKRNVYSHITNSYLNQMERIAEEIYERLNT